MKSYLNDWTPQGGVLQKAFDAFGDMTSDWQTTPWDSAFKTLYTNSAAEACKCVHAKVANTSFKIIQLWQPSFSCAFHVTQICSQMTMLVKRLPAGAVGHSHMVLTHTTSSIHDVFSLTSVMQTQQGFKVALHACFGALMLLL